MVPTISTIRPTKLPGLVAPAKPPPTASGGLLVHSGGGKPPALKFFVPHHPPTGREVAICRNFVWQGFNNCTNPFAHIPNMRFCDDEVVAEFVSFVTRQLWRCQGILEDSCRQDHK